MRNAEKVTAGFDGALAARLTHLRQARGLTLEALAEKADVSRASLSRIERGETSPTAAVLGRLAAAFEVPMADLFTVPGLESSPLVRLEDQPVWTDAKTGFVRRSVSPSVAGYRGTVIEGHLPAGETVAYSSPPVVGLEHHVVLLEGRLRVLLGETSHDLEPGDCLRFRLSSSNSYCAPGPDAARYLLTVITS